MNCSNSSNIMAEEMPKESKKKKRRTCRNFCTVYFCFKMLSLLSLVWNILCNSLVIFPDLRNQDVFFWVLVVLCIAMAFLNLVKFCFYGLFLKLTLFCLIDSINEKNDIAKFEALVQQFIKAKKEKQNSKRKKKLKKQKS